VRLALLQINPTVGALDANADAIVRAVRSLTVPVDLCITPELALCGYPPRDLLLQRAFVARVREVLDRVAAATQNGPPVLVGLPIENPRREGRPLVNAAALLQDGRVTAICAKSLLPTYDVFDEDRYFEAGAGISILDVAGRRCAVSICEDVWNDRDFWQRPRYHRDPIEEARDAGAEVVLNLSASPFEAGKQRVRERMLGALATKHEVPIVYVNQVGGNDDLVFDGRSTVVGKDGSLLARGAAFREDVVVVDLGAGARVEPDDTLVEAEIYEALVLGTRDYARKCGFARALVGLSGGIDSALTAAIAADALGADRVLGVMMPSPYSSAGSIDDSVALARHCGIQTETLPIASIMGAFDDALRDVFAGRERDVTEENIQARIRGNLLMAISNKTGALLLTTGNKSELAVGYCTLYGDMSGGLAVIADVPKTMVYRVSRWLNARDGRAIIPESILTKAPSAELRPNQTDQDSLPPYDVLDAILERHIEDHQSHHEIVAAGFDSATVRQVLRLVRIAEFKRKQAAPGLKVTDRAFGTGWRMPIARSDWDRRD